tara:strand:- start:15439 stop:16470 length:1032 start_codon:yes stop_codon:yes gene_type:complete
MKKIMILALLAISFLGHSQSKQKYLSMGKRTQAQIDAIDVSDTSYIYTAYNVDNAREEINTGLGWVARISGAVAATVDYADLLNKPANIDENSLNDVELSATSPTNTIFWEGTKAQLYAEYGNPPIGLQNYIYVVTDSIPPTPIGGGDMLKSIYDANVNLVVDNSERLGGLLPSSYLTTEIDGSTTNELQALSILGQDISLSNGGGTVTIPTAPAPTATAFTPLLTDAGGGATYTAASSIGNYFEYGNAIHFMITITNIETVGTPTGELRITGFPFSSIIPSAVSVNFNGYINQNFYSLQGVMSTSYMRFQTQQAFDDLMSTHLTAVTIDSGSGIYITGTYFK